MENELLIRVSKGDEGAFRQLYDLYRKKIYSIAFKLIRIESVAEDAVQEVFLRLWLHREKLTEINYFTSYLNIVTRNYILNALRKMAHEDAFLRNLVSESKRNKDEFDVVVFNQLQNLINKAVDRLPPQQKKVYLLSRGENLSHEEIAHQLNISRSTVKGHLISALKFIKSYLLSHADFLLLILFLSEFSIPV